jgi:hypothetical protein
MHPKSRVLIGEASFQWAVRSLTPPSFRLMRWHVVDASGQLCSRPRPRPGVLGLGEWQGVEGDFTSGNLGEDRLRGRAPGRSTIRW